MTSLSEITGRVVDDAGVPVAEARIVIVSSSVPMPEIALLTDALGRFSLRVPPGTFTLRAHGTTGAGETEVSSPTLIGDVLIVVAERG